MEISPNRDSLEPKRESFTSHCQKQEKRPFLLTQMKMREPTSRHNFDNHYRSESGLSVEEIRKIEFSRTIEVTGSNAFSRYSESHRGNSQSR